MDDNHASGVPQRVPMKRCKAFLVALIPQFTFNSLGQECVPRNTAYESPLLSLLFNFNVSLWLLFQQQLETLSNSARTTKQTKQMWRNRDKALVTVSASSNNWMQAAETRAITHFAQTEMLPLLLSALCGCL
jgi:hypothetical protein